MAEYSNYDKVGVCIHVLLHIVQESLVMNGWLVEIEDYQLTYIPATSSSIVSCLNRMFEGELFYSGVLEWRTGIIPKECF